MTNEKGLSLYAIEGEIARLEELLEERGGDVTDADGRKIYKVRSGTFYAPGAPRSVWVGMKYMF